MHQFGSKEEEEAQKAISLQSIGEIGLKGGEGFAEALVQVERKDDKAAIVVLHRRLVYRIGVMGISLPSTSALSVRPSLIGGRFAGDKVARRASC